ncbi:MAG: glycosyltransferase family 2 protein [Arcticibacter sp.]
MLVFYVVFFFLILRFTISLFNFISNPKLPVSPRRYTDLVSILIPARNEAGRIEHLLQSILGQSYQHYEVLVLDDQSTDDTYQICESFSRLDSRIRVIRGNALPDGWLGKNFACHQLGQVAKGRYFMFIDADTRVGEGLIDNAVHRTKRGRLALLSLFANQVMETIGERIVVPLMHFILLNLLPLRLVRISKNASFAAASGQFMMFDGPMYQIYHWHAQVRDKVLDDMEIAKLVKTYRLPTETLLANGFLFCRMYSGYDEAVNGFSKNILAGFNRNIAGLICYLLLVMIGPLFIAYYLSLSLFMFAVTLILLSRIMISLMSGQHVLWNVLLHPVQMVSLSLIAIVSIIRHFTRQSMWKGRSI